MLKLSKYTFRFLNLLIVSHEVQIQLLKLNQNYIICSDTKYIHEKFILLVKKCSNMKRLYKKLYKTKLI